MKRILFAFLLASLSLGMWTAPAAAADPTPAFVPDEVVIQYRAGTTAPQETGARGRVNAAHRSTIRAEANDAGRLEVATLPAGANVQAAVAALQADPAVAFAEPNWIYTTGPVLAVRSPNDPYVDKGYIWGLYGDADKVLDAATYDALKNTYHLGGNIYGSQANEGWAFFQSHNLGVGSKDVHVAVIDTGIDYRHADLDANIWINPKDVADGVDNDGNGYVDDVNGWNFAAGTNQTFVEGDDEDHGTHVAGTIGAEGNNATGVAGVNWNVSLITAKFFGSGPGNATLESATKAVYYLIDLKTRHGLNLAAINASWGCYCYSQALYDAIERAGAETADILFIAAAGNDTRNNDGRTKFYPASYNLPNIISVAAIDEKGALASFSNYGAKTVHLGAPGVSIGSTGEGGTYVWMSGTSMAAPHVTGAAALYAAKVVLYENRASTGTEIKKALLNNTLPTSSLRRKTITNGRLDISCALETIVKSSDGTISAATCAQ